MRKAALVLMLLVAAGCSTARGKYEREPRTQEMPARGEPHWLLRLMEALLQDAAKRT